MPEIPDYPQFTALEFGHKRLFDEAFKKNPPEISEFTFTNLFSWRKAYGYKVALLKGSLILRSDAGRLPCFLAPIGQAQPTGIVERILKDTKGSFIRVPENLAVALAGDNRFKVEEDRNNWDYLYLSSDLIDLAGKKYDGKRNQIKKFTSEYNYNYLDIRASDAGQVLGFEEAWCTIKDCDHVEGLNNEREAIRQIIAHFADFGLLAGIITVKENIRAMAIAEALNAQTLVMHILKADPALAGLYQVMLNDFLHRRGKDFQYVNLEQDLGIPGLRAAKGSYHPVKLIKKYTISLKE